MLEPEDAEEIERMLAVLRWGNQFEEPSDVAVVQRYDALMQDITNPLVRDILAHVMDVRMIAVALRCRRRGLAFPRSAWASGLNTSAATSTSLTSSWARSFPGSRRPSGCSRKGIC